MTRTRSTAQERRTDVCSPRRSASSRSAACTAPRPRRSPAAPGISHAYLFRLFGTKKQLFIACAQLCFRRVEATFAAAAVGETPAERLESMGSAYREMLADRELLLGQMQLYAACSDPEIREVARDGFQAAARARSAGSRAPTASRCSSSSRWGCC